MTVLENQIRRIAEKAVACITCTGLELSELKMSEKSCQIERERKGERERERESAMADVDCHNFNLTTLLLLCERKKAGFRRRHGLSARGSIVVRLTTCRRLLFCLALKNLK
jgi:hypothetical protein